MKKLFCFLLTVCLMSMADDVEVWHKQLTETLAEVKKVSVQEARLLHETERMTKFKDPLMFEADVTGLQQLCLIADDAGDSNSGDHCVWVNPIFTTADGKEISGIDVRIVENYVQWNRLNINKNFMGEPITVNNVVYPKGWWAHANSYIVLQLDGKYTKFRAGVGVDKRADSPQSKIHFAAYDRLPSWWPLNGMAASLDSHYPTFSAYLREDYGNGQAHHALLSRYADAKGAFSDLIRRCGATMGGAETRYLKTLSAYQAVADTPLLSYMKLFAEIHEAKNASKDVVEAAALLQRTFDYVNKAVPLTDVAAKVAAVKAVVTEKLGSAEVDWLAFLRDVRALRREILFRHPQLAFRDLLINKVPPPTYSHMVDQYLGRRSRPGAGLVVLHDWKSAKPQEEALLAGKLPTGAVTHPDLSYDGKKILFSYCDHTPSNADDRRFFIYEINADGTGLRQVTGGASDAKVRIGNRNTVLIEDFDPCYLPDGGIVFVSTRCQSYGRCHGGRYTPAYFLYRMNGDGTGIRALSFGEANEWDPSVLSDGRIIYTRWDYINRHDTIYQSLWTMRPDGTGTAHYYGNYTRNPCMIAEARAIPGSSKTIATAMAHHSYTSGSIIQLDPTKGEDGPEPITRMTPEIPFPETEGWPSQPCASPWPVNEEMAFVAVGNERLVWEGQIQAVNAYRIILVDTLGGREEIYSDTAMSCMSPIPLQPREMPPVLCSTLPATAEGTAQPGTVYIQNANVSRIKHDTPIRAIRLNTIICQPTAAVPSRSAAANEITKRVTGTVPVHEDGKAYFSMPSGTPIQLQALDENGMAVLTMRSFIYVQPGELLSCVGCHENKAQTAPQAPVKLGRPDGVTPLAGQEYAGGFSYVRSVQPVWDRYCISCHGFGKATEKLDLRGIFDARRQAWSDFSRSYKAIVSKPGMIHLAQRNQETGTSEQKDYFAHSGAFGRKLLAGHCPALKADRESFALVMSWLDLNVQFFGDYSFSRLEGRGIDADVEKALRAFIRERFGEDIASQPIDTLVNVAAPEKSRILLMALPIAQGGWGQVKKGAFASREEPEWQRLEALVHAVLRTVQTAHPDGTCGLKGCPCRNCWVSAKQ